MKQICDALGIKSESLKFEWGSEIDWQLLREHLASSKIKFKVVSLVHHETTTGILNSLSELCKIAKEYNLRTLVDAMSSYAGIKIDLTVNSVEYLISSSNKCIQGMAGVGIVIAKRDELERIKIFKKRSYYFDLFSNYNSQKERKQFLFTPPVQTLYALNAALDEFFEEGGIDFRSAKYSELYDLMLKGLNDIGFKALLDQRNNSKILTTFLEPLDDKFSFKGMHKYLFERGITIYPGKIDEKDTFRISNIGHLTREDIVKFLHLVKEYLSTEGIELN
jgi:2-aminoethylphosphonate-pyruvate transaminase